MNRSRSGSGRTRHLAERRYTLNVPMYLTLLGALLVQPCVLRGEQDITIEIASTQTAVLDPVEWDEVIPDELYFDAIRAMLVRFPDAAQQIHDRLRQGHEIKRAELVLNWDRQEGFRPQRGRHGWSTWQYRNDPGQWHVQAKLLRQPWSIDDPELGPTFNASINGVSFWQRGGARGDNNDRFDELFGPAPLHEEQPEARLDVTATLTSEAFGPTVGERLRAIADHGFQVHKTEMRDMKYRHRYAYDFEVSIGYKRIWVQHPRLIIRLQAKPDASPGPLPPPVDIVAQAQKIKSSGGGGRPSTQYPAGLAERAAAHWQQPEHMPDWQWQRTSELRALARDPHDVRLGLGRGFNWAALFANNKEAYLAAMRELLRMPPRHWQGHLTSDFALLPVAYGDLLPPAVHDHLKLYWDAWLHPEVKRPFCEDIGGEPQQGGPTYFRGYTSRMGTVNFSHNANMGALLGGQYIQAPYVVDNARYGVEHVLMRAHIVGQGAHQEIGDTYYQALTVASAAAIANYAEEPFDRLMGRILTDRLIEPLISMYHPGIRRLTHPQARGRWYYHFLLHEGPINALHTLSRQGTLIHLDDLRGDRTGMPSDWGEVHGLQIFRCEGPPMRIAVVGPWADGHLADPFADIVDDKTYPWSVHARCSSPGLRPGGWHVNYLSRHYALASRDNASFAYGLTSVVGQWRREAQQVRHLDDSGHLLLTFGSDDRWSQGNRIMGEFGIVHHQNKMIAMKRLPPKSVIERNAVDKEAIHSLHTSAMLAAFGDTSEREVWINDQRADTLSGARQASTEGWLEHGRRPGQESVESSGARITASDGDVITIKDGVTYLGLIPITANPLTRQRQVEIAFEHPIMLIHSYIYDDPQTAIDLDELEKLEHAPTAGFILEMGDVTEYESFEAFRRHMNAARFQATWDRDQRHLDIRYKSGNDVLEMAYDPVAYPAVSRAVNGEWPYLPEGVERQSDWAMQSRIGRIEKLGAVLETEPGREAYMLAVPQADTFVAYNLLPDPTLWAFHLPDGKRLQSDGRLGLTRVAAKPDENRLWVQHAWSPASEQQTLPDAATALLAFGWHEPPVLTLNGQPYSQTLEPIQIDGETAYIIPLTNESIPDAAQVKAQYRRFLGQMHAVRDTYLLDWHVAGPFAEDFQSPRGPQGQEVDLTAVYKGLDDAQVRWQRTVEDQAPPLGLGAVDLEAIFQPGQRASAYAYTRIRSDVEREVTLFFGSPTNADLWINGQSIYSRRDYYRICYPDQDRLVINLRQGVNHVLLRVGRQWEDWSFSFRLADEYGLPLTTPVEYLTAQGAVKAGRVPE